MTSPLGQPSLTVLSGAAEGKVFVVEDSMETVLVGSDPSCRFCVPGPEVEPIHARLWIDLDGITVGDASATGGTYINDARVQGEGRLRNSDILWLGPPGHQRSVMLLCRIPPVRPPSILAPDAIQPEPPVRLASDDDLLAELEPAIAMLPDDPEISAVLGMREPPPVMPPAPVPAPVLVPVRRSRRPPPPPVRERPPARRLIAVAVIVAAALAAGGWWLARRPPAVARDNAGPAPVASAAPAALDAPIEEQVTIVPPDPSDASPPPAPTPASPPLP